MKTAVIRNRVIGDGYPPYFIAELGTCHEGRVDIAKQLCRAAKEAGVDCIKTEMFQREDIVFDPEFTYSCTIAGKKYEEPLIRHMKRYQLSFEEHEEISQIYTLTGETDILIKVKAKSLDDLTRFVVNNVTNTPGVNKSKTAIVIDRVKNKPGVPIKHIIVT